MKRIFTLCMAVCITFTAIAQTDSTKQENKADTIRIGGMIIIRDQDGKNRRIERDSIPRMRNRKSEKPSNVSTNWWILDLGFSNYDDESVYPNVLAPTLVKDDLKLKTGKSRNVNFWIFMQRLNIVKHVVNLKYGVGLELNNYHFDNQNIVFSKKPTLISEGTTEFKKVKLAADYLTVPIMLNFNFTPNKKKAFGISAGVSGGYLYSARYKTKEDGDVKKVKSNFNLEKFKLSYIGELSLGPVRLYASVAMKNMWEKGLDMTPYNFGFRFSNW